MAANQGSNGHSWDLNELPPPEEMGLEANLTGTPLSQLCRNHLALVSEIQIEAVRRHSQNILDIYQRGLVMERTDLSCEDRPARRSVSAVSANGACVTNRNPADFSIPRAWNTRGGKVASSERRRTN